tara:strand:+ start:78 stop:641 length:564 start_codon:yes stop_codon:yes gene_type:complete
MGAYRRRMNRNSFYKENFDKKVDQFIEVGRQFVDGVSGARPGSRKSTNLKDFSRKNIRNVGKWVNAKMENFLDDDYEDDWEDEKRISKNDVFQSHIYEDRDLQSYTPSTSKRPLEAISLREPQKRLKELKRLSYADDPSSQDWPIDSDFQVQKWQRSPQKTDELMRNNCDSDNQRGRVLPRSRRRRI